MEEETENQLPEDFYEIEDVLERRLCNNTLTYEYKVRFKGYSSEEDMWLPVSYFNRAIHFQSLSKSGRKRKHKIDPDAAHEFSIKIKKTSSGTEKDAFSKESSRNKKGATNTETKRRARDKGKVFRSTLPSSFDVDVNSSEVTQSASLETPGTSDQAENSTPPYQIKANTSSVIHVDDTPTDDFP